MKWLVLGVMVVIAISLFSALVPLANAKHDRQKMVRSLAVRVGFSLALFLLLLIGGWMGWIQPHGLAIPGAGL